MGMGDADYCEVESTLYIYFYVSGMKGFESNYTG